MAFDHPSALQLLEQLLSPASRTTLHITVSRLGDIELVEDGVFHTLRQKESTLTMDLHVTDDVGKELLLALVGHADVMKVLESFDWRRV